MSAHFVRGNHHFLRIAVPTNLLKQSPYDKSNKELDPLTNVFGLPNMKIMNGAFEQISVVIISLQHIPVSHVKQFCSTGC